MQLPPIGLGTMGIEAPETIATALEVGYRHLDTAQIYGNEGVVGDGLARSDVSREKVQVATKVWADSLEPDAVRRTTEESLERLGLESVDLLYVHRPIETYDPERTLPAFDALSDAGVVDGIGLSNFSREELETARGVLDAPIAAHQVEYHPLFQPENLLEHAREHGYPLVAYSPLANGRAGEIEAVVAVAEKHDVTPEAVCLAWLAAKDGVVPIPKASSRGHLTANLEARAIDLEPADVERIDGIERTEELFPE
ncbi:2,5-diketo-D-gluconate reductase B [Halobiforma haloterrestris]|uniref:2,5-diketo-D-gluconate reductase B n=1 Tax=Natronobacterium haloterrestre TaxID=148448 RepID=A0A1I1D6U1_NATHA|nr:aldo/keto reductase [Halobiforma haloterrestris]SFB70661.1 2,5-diketo-D-gluconate reductase B [Halobiforma haloterrestris]